MIKADYQQVVNTLRLHFDIADMSAVSIFVVSDVEAFRQIIISGEEPQFDVISVAGIMLRAMYDRNKKRIYIILPD